MADSLAELARDVAAVESLRAIKDLERAYAHHRQLARHDDLAALFTTDAAITVDGAPAGLPAASAFVTEFIDEPVVTLLDGGDRARGRWMSLTFEGDGEGRARISGGLYENEYRREGGAWLISGHHYFPQFEGDYANGWTNVGGADLPVIPYHFTAADAGAPVRPSARRADIDAAPLDELATRIGRLNDEDAVRNLVHAYGYYVDRRMWDDVVDLFAPGGAMAITGAGVFRGADGIRTALETMGPAGLDTGDLNDRPLFDTVVAVSPDGSEAVTRSIELGMLARDGVGAWEVNVVRTRCVRDGVLFKLAEVRIDAVMRAGYADGWGDAKTPATIPPLGSPTGPGLSRASGTPRSTGADDAATLRRRLARSLAYDATENVSSAYGYYIDDFRWDDMADLHAEKGNKQSPFAGYYLGKERIHRAVTELWGAPPDTRPGISYHWRTQPVIHVSADGRSAHLRTRLFQPRTHKEHLPEGAFYAAGFHAGMYPNDQTVLEPDGVWRLWSLTIDEPYFTSPTWKGGWAAVGPRDEDAPAPRPNPLLERFPPDVLLTDLGRREEHFRGGTGDVIEWPGILPMWFHYRNPVSGRVPEHYWPDCVPSQVRPDTRMTAHGYQHPPNGPEVDGVELDPL